MEPIWWGGLFIWEVLVFAKGNPDSFSLFSSWIAKCIDYWRFSHIFVLNSLENSNADITTLLWWMFLSLSFLLPVFIRLANYLSHCNGWGSSAPCHPWKPSSSGVGVIHFNNYTCSSHFISAHEKWEILWSSFYFILFYCLTSDW